MYLEFFKLREFPFRLTPDTEFLYMSGGHSRAKAYMDYTIWNRDGFVVITGEVGAGKTTLIQKLLSELDSNIVVAKLFQTQLDEVEFLQAVLVEFGLNPFTARKVELLDMLNTFLIDQFHQDKQLVLIVDDAHNLGVKALEEIRMLSGIETRKEKILHVILVGQPQLSETLESPELEQLLQRVRLRYHIKALSEPDTRVYIEHRLRTAGLSDGALFQPDTYAVIHKYTGGLPRLINTLCDTCLVCAYADQATVVDRKVLNGAIQELQWLPYAKRVSQKLPAAPSAEFEAYQNVLKHHANALMNIGNQLGHLDALLPVLSGLAGKMAGIDKTLKHISETLDIPAPKSIDEQKAKHNKG